jgi:hypothetical protein
MWALKGNEAEGARRLKQATASGAGSAAFAHLGPTVTRFLLPLVAHIYSHDRANETRRFVPKPIEVVVLERLCLVHK